jgi:hypothetical protein
MIGRLLLIAGIMLLSSAAVGAELGTVQFEGKDVILSDDNTWRYAGEVAATNTACDPADVLTSNAVKISACVEHATWEAGDGTGAQEFVFFSKDGNVGFAIITEAAYAPSAAYRDAIVAFAAQAGGVAPEDIKVFNERDETFGGKIWGVMRYQVSTDGTLLEFVNYRYSDAKLGSTQFVFWTLPEMVQVAVPMAQKVMETVKVGG